MKTGWVFAVLLSGLLATGSMAGAGSGKAENSSSVVVFDVWNYFEKAGIKEVQHQADVLYMLTSLQGIVNRDQPRLYLLLSQSLFDLESKYLAEPDRDTRPVTELDALWLDYFTEKGWVDPASIRQAKTLSEVVVHFKGDIEGLAKWEVSVPSTINAAFMAAGAEDLLPVSDSLADGKLLAWFGKEFPELKVKLDMSGAFRGGETKVLLDGIKFKSCGSAKNDVYRFAMKRFMKPRKLDSHWMWYNCDASMWQSAESWSSAFYGRELYERLGDRASFQNNGLYNADYWISRRAVFFDLYPWADSLPTDDPGQRMGEDAKTWNDILELSYRQRKGKFGVVGGFVPWWIKYTDRQGGPHHPVAVEWRFIELLTSYNMVNDADAAFGLSNASFFQHMPKIPKEKCRWNYPESLKLEPGTTYIAFMMMDYDGSAWLNQAAVSIYRDEARGRIPLNWCINPVLNERVPHAFRYMVENRTDKDFFGIESDGVGYLSPYFLQPGVRLGRIQESGLKEYERYANHLRKRFGYRHTAFYITPAHDVPWMEMAARINPEGYGLHKPPQIEPAGGVPVFTLKEVHVGRVLDGKFEQMLDEVYARSVAEPDTTRMEAWRCILVTPSHLVDAVEKMEKKYPGAKVKIVDWPNLLRLKKQHLRQRSRNQN
ncbi:MAG: GxGYxYP domain-containing protein [Verrucomicrobiota bacterium]